MSFLNDIRTTTRKYVAQISNANDRIKDFEKKGAMYSREYFQKERSKLEMEKQDILNRGYSDIQALADAYKKKVQDADAFDGSKVTDDAKLLTGAFKLKSEDLEAMFDRAAADRNRTMMRAVSDYVREHIQEFAGFPRVFYTAADKMEAADIMAQYARNAFSRPEYSDIMDSDRYFEQITPAAIKGE